MRDKLNIPKKINVGFQNRADTYTGKLAYVVYTDAKGVLRKEASWSSWRDKKIDPQEFDNAPTSGFVLNKKVGDYSGGWHGRRAAIRIYDPRNFEFEIKVDNLLFILEETSAIKGKGLEGDFVYAWDGADLVLLPASSQEYKNSMEFTELQTKKITKTDIKEGCLYRNKDNEQVMYLGRYDWYELTSSYGRYSSYKCMSHAKHHIFVSVDGKSTYWTQDGFTKLAARLSEEPSPLFAEEFEKFKKSNHGAKPVKLVSKVDGFTRPSNQTYFDHYTYLKEKDQYFPVRITHSWRGGYNYNYGYGSTAQPAGYRFVIHGGSVPVALTADKLVLDKHLESEKEVSHADISQMEFYKLFIENEHGTLIEL